jgi:hypothetical protein
VKERLLLNRDEMRRNERSERMKVMHFNTISIVCSYSFYIFSTFTL